MHIQSNKSANLCLVIPFESLESQSTLRHADKARGRCSSLYFVFGHSHFLV